MHGNSVTTRKEAPFKLTSPYKDPFRRTFFSLAGGALERVLAIDQINHIYYAASDKTDNRHFMDKVLEVLNISYEVSSYEMERIPRSGPVIVVANHPFGGIEGIILSALLHSVRPDVKLMANFILERIPDLREHMIFVDPFERQDSFKMNMKPLKDSIRWLKGGGMLGVFPAGEVSHIDLKKGRIVSRYRV